MHQRKSVNDGLCFSGSYLNLMLGLVVIPVHKAIFIPSELYYYRVLWEFVASAPVCSI